MAVKKPRPIKVSNFIKTIELRACLIKDDGTESGSHNNIILDMATGNLALNLQVYTALPPQHLRELGLVLVEVAREAEKCISLYSPNHSSHANIT